MIDSEIQKRGFGPRLRKGGFQFAAGMVIGIVLGYLTYILLV